jgi:beta-glucosidase
VKALLGLHGVSIGQQPVSSPVILAPVSELLFPKGFLWGTATAGHQVEGGNDNSDWWEFENRPESPCREPSGNAIEHYKRYPADITLMAGLGLNTYRFSVEWPRIEPAEGEFDVAQLEHYRQMVEACRKNRLEPMVTLNHFTLPLWLARQGGWLSPSTPRLFERFARRTVEALGEGVGWYCTLNEPGWVAFGGYGGGGAFPPMVEGLGNWKKAIHTQIEAHKRGRDVVKQLRPQAMVGLTNAMSEWEHNAGGRSAVRFTLRMGEDPFIRAAEDDDFFGVQTYTRNIVNIPRLAGAAVTAAMAIPPIERRVLQLARRRGTHSDAFRDPEVRRTQMGWEFRPQAVAWTVRRAAAMLPGKPIVVTEHGVATSDDAERVEFITEGLKALHAVIADGIPLRGYIHWSAFDNFEWAAGYAMEFGLIAVDRRTQVRTLKPSARFLGQIARKNKLVLPDS